MPSVLITSANRGLGFEFARQYARDGWRVFAACRHPERASEIEGLSRTSDGRVQILAMDVTDQQGVKKVAAKINDAVDLLINSAGIIGKRGERLGAVDYEAWWRVLDVNTIGPLRVTEAFIDHVARSERKLIVTITSGMGSLAENTSGGSIAYRSSKAAVNMVMRSLAIELAPRSITCVLLNPGWVRTDMGGPNASITPTESVTALRRTIESLSPAQSGRFFNYDGREHPW